MKFVLPTLRDDRPSVRSRRRAASGAISFIKYPVTGRFFRFRETEQFIAGQYDGATAVETVRKRTEEKLGGPLLPETLNDFISRLDKVGLLETAKLRRRGTARRPRIASYDTGFFPQSFRVSPSYSNPKQCSKGAGSKSHATNQ